MSETDDKILNAINELRQDQESRWKELNLWINGNGKPGVKTRLDRLEQYQARQINMQKWLVTSVTSLGLVLAGVLMRMVLAG